MDTKTQLLVCVGAASAANCNPCFEHYYKKASEAKIEPSDIKEAVALAHQMKQGAIMSMRSTVESLIKNGQKGGREEGGCGCVGIADKLCCG